MLTAQKASSPWLWTAAVVGVSAHFAITYDWSHAPFLKLDQYAAGQSALPYQARILMAWILRITTQWHVVQVMAAHAPAQLRSPYLIVQTVCVFLAMVSATLATRASITTLTRDRSYARAACFVLPLMAYFNLVLDYGLSYTLPYDVPSLAFFCSGILLIVRSQWAWFYPLFVVAMLNRETAVFLTLILAAWMWAQRSESSVLQRVRRIAPHVLAQATIAAGVKLWLRHHFAGNPTEGHGNGLFANALQTNVHSLMNPGQWPLFLSLFAFLPIPLWLGRRHIRNRGLALATTITVPLWIITMLVVGVLVEVRVFNELAALLALVAALEAYHLWFSHRPKETA